MKNRLLGSVSGGLILWVFVAVMSYVLRPSRPLIEYFELSMGYAPVAVLLTWLAWPRPVRDPEQTFRLGWLFLAGALFWAVQAATDLPVLGDSRIDYGMVVVTLLMILGAASRQPWGWYTLLLALVALASAWSVTALVGLGRPDDYFIVLVFSLVVHVCMFGYVYRRRAMFGAHHRLRWLERGCPFVVGPEGEFVRRIDERTETTEELNHRLDRLQRDHRHVKEVGAALLLGLAALVLFNIWGRWWPQKAHELVVLDSAGNARAVLEASGTGSPILLLYDKDSRIRTSLAVRNDSTPGLVFYGRDGRRRVILGLTTDDTANLYFLDKEGKILWKAP